MKRIFAALAAVFYLVTSAAAVDVTIGGTTYHAYANVQWQGAQTSSQVVFLDSVVVDGEGSEIGFNASATADWDLVKASIERGHLVASLWEAQTWSTTVDTVVDSGVIYIVADRDSLLSTRYRSLRKAGSYGATIADELPDSIAATIANDSLSAAPTVRRLKAAMTEFLSRWATPDTVVMTREKYNEMIGQ